MPSHRSSRQKGAQGRRKYKPGIVKNSTEGALRAPRSNNTSDIGAASPRSAMENHSTVASSTVASEAPAPSGIERPIGIDKIILEEVILQSMDEAEEDPWNVKESNAFGSEVSSSDDELKSEGDEHDDENDHFPGNSAEKGTSNIRYLEKVPASRFPKPPSCQTININRKRISLSFYVSIARRYLRDHELIQLTGVGRAVPKTILIADMIAERGYAIEDYVKISSDDSETENSDGKPKGRIQVWMVRPDQVFTRKSGECSQGTLEKAEGEFQNTLFSKDDTGCTSKLRRTNTKHGITPASIEYLEPKIEPMETKQTTNAANFEAEVKSKAKMEDPAMGSTETKTVATRMTICTQKQAENKEYLSPLATTTEKQEVSEKKAEQKPLTGHTMERKDVTETEEGETRDCSCAATPPRLINLFVPSPQQAPRYPPLAAFLCQQRTMFPPNLPVAGTVLPVPPDTTWNHGMAYCDNGCLILPPSLVPPGHLPRPMVVIIPVTRALPPMVMLPVLSLGLVPVSLIPVRLEGFR